ncbi:hypothetical protein C2G38_24343 [Gigaspora rosea]|uniref:Uncharacterized protein n=1 Tax=Gigaspora rosea TaxID=44941 RepID=A0A397UQH0_9GLOM|nr:hypothetical protein C2G38_24343 [Gigaspora rosea]
MQNGEESRYWPREKFGRARDQFEYDEWCKVGRILDNALVNRDWEMRGKVRNVAATRAFTLRVAKREGWNVAARIRDLLDDDPMEVFFQEKLASARQSARNNCPRWDGESEISGAFFPNGPGEMGGMASNPMAHWSMPGQQYFQQPGQPGFVPGGIFTYRSMLPYPSAY